MKNFSVSDLISRFQPGNSQFQKLLLREKQSKQSKSWSLETRGRGL